MSWKQREEIRVAERYLPPLLLLLFYFLGTSISILGQPPVNVDVPFAFLWLIWVLKKGFERQRELERRIEKIEER